MRRTPLIRQGAGPTAAARIEAEIRDELDRATLPYRDYLADEPVINLNAHLSLIGDEQQLRGIPCIAEGVPGTMPGTVPGRRIAR